MAKKPVAPPPPPKVKKTVPQKPKKVPAGMTTSAWKKAGRPTA